jgi:transcriptional regulator with XRE-family HTH domain
MNVGLRVKQLRKMRNMTTKELSNLCGVSQSTISKLENGNRIPDIPIIEKICDALNITLLDFFMTEKMSEPLNEGLVELVYIAKNLDENQLKKLCTFLRSVVENKKAEEKVTFEAKNSKPERVKSIV